MKNGKKPTVRQRKIIETALIKSSDFLVYKDTPTEMCLIHRNDGTREIIKKGTENA